MKKLFILVVAMALVIGAGNVFAFGDIEDNDTTNNGIIGDKNHHNIINTGEMNNGPLAGGTVINKGGEGGDGGSVNIGNGMLNKNFSPEATIEKGAVDIDIEGDKQINKQLAIQGNKQSMVYNEAKNPVNYDHISATAPSSTPDMITHPDADDIKTKFGLFEELTEGEITQVQARMASKGAPDVKVLKSLMFEGKDQLNNLFLTDKKRGTYMGTITVVPDGDDVTKAGIEARLALEAMKAGATHIMVINGQGYYADATQKGIGFGGSASVATTGSGSAVVAPAFGTGWSNVKSANEYRPSVTAKCYYDESGIVK